MADFYKTIQDISEGLYKEKMSKFISFAIPVSSAEEAKETYEINNNGAKFVNADITKLPLDYFEKEFSVPSCV